MREYTFKLNWLFVIWVGVAYFWFQGTLDPCTSLSIMGVASFAKWPDILELTWRA